MKVNFSKVKLLDVEGVLIKGHSVHKTLADALYKFSKSVDLVDIALKINKGQEVELSLPDIAVIKEVINNPNSGFYTFARKALLDYLEVASKKGK